jgi:ligand-binding SRPBCC domain-containing protein
MSEFLFETEQVLAAPLGRAFAFYSDAGNLEGITPPFLQFRIVTARPIEMRVGTVIDYSLRLHGVRFAWRSVITVWEPPLDGERGRFVDEQVKGPYRFWIHEHVLERAGSGTVVRDRVRYGVPGGRLVERWFVRPRIEAIFAYRAEATKRLIDGKGT